MQKAPHASPEGGTEDNSHTPLTVLWLGLPDGWHFSVGGPSCCRPLPPPERLSAPCGALVVLARSSAVAFRFCAAALPLRTRCTRAAVATPCLYARPVGWLLGRADAGFSDLAPSFHALRGRPRTMQAARRALTSTAEPSLQFQVAHCNLGGFSTQWKF